MKNILLISPNSTPEINESRYVSPAPGVVRLAGYLNNNGHYAEAFDPNLYDLDNTTITLKEKILERKWDIIGVSCLEETLVNDISNIWLAKKLSPDSLLVAGGIEAQYNYQTILDKSPCNIVVIGEGEIPLLMMCDEKRLDEIPGIVIKNKAWLLSQGDFSNATESIDWENIPYESYWNYYVKKYGDTITEEIKKQIYTIRVFSKNRCPFSCKFCTSSNQLSDATGTNAKCHGLSVDSLIGIIKRIREAHPLVKTIYLTDDDFCMNSEYVIDFCKQLIRKNLHTLYYMCFARVTDLNDEMLMWMKYAGFRRLNIGIESFSDDVLDEVGKKCTSEQIRKNLTKLKTHGIEGFLTFMLITPGTTIEDLMITVNQTMKYCDDPYFTLGLSLGVRPTKGSEFFETNYDFETYITKINTFIKEIYIKENKMIYARDPVVKSIQLLYKSREKEYVNEYIKMNNIKHSTYSNLAKAQLNLLKECIDLTIKK